MENAKLVWVPNGARCRAVQTPRTAERVARQPRRAPRVPAPPDVDEIALALALRHPPMDCLSVTRRVHIRVPPALLAAVGEAEAVGAGAGVPPQPHRAPVLGLVEVRGPFKAEVRDELHEAG